MKHTDARSITPEAQREKRIIALNMREQGYSFVAIGEAIGVHGRTVQKWLARVAAEGVDAAIEGKPAGTRQGNSGKSRPSRNRRSARTSPTGCPTN
jgi:transposase